MPFSHNRLEVYQHAIEFVKWSKSIIDSAPADDSIRTQLNRASASVPLNIAEGNSKSSKRDRARYWQTALGSAFECAAILDVMVARTIRDEAEVAEGRDRLERIAGMLMALLRSVGCRIAK